MLFLRIGVLFLFVIKPSDINFGLPLNDSSLSWSFYYANVLLMKGDLNSPPTEYEVNVQQDPVRDLLITVNYAGSAPARSVLLVRNDSGFVIEYVYESPGSPDALTPAVGTGPHFILPVRDIIGPAEGSGSYKAHFSLQDGVPDSQVHLGSITFTIR